MGIVIAHDPSHNAACDSRSDTSAKHRPTYTVQALYGVITIAFFFFFFVVFDGLIVINDQVSPDGSHGQANTCNSDGLEIAEKMSALAAGELGISPRDAPKVEDSVRDSGQTFVFGKADSGETVNEKSAMQIATVYACVRLLAESVAGLPLNLYRYTDDAGRDKERAT